MRHKEKKQQLILSFFICILILLGSTKSLAQEVDEGCGFSGDPFEHFNRSVFIFNEKLDNYILKPVATVYSKVLPTPLNQGINNFFNNVNELPTIANDLLQLNFYQLSRSVWRFVINSTVGIVGIFDVAVRAGVQPHVNDFGLTLATWGWKHSTYLVLPFFGPNTFRDGVGIPVDYYGFSIYPRIHPTFTRYKIYALGVVSRRAQFLDYQNVLEEAAIDRYTFMRNAYMQRRCYQLQQNKDFANPQQAISTVTDGSGANNPTIENKTATDSSLNYDNG